MPSIIDYSIVLERMTARGFRCNYYNGGSFGFGVGAQTEIRGWIGPPDSTIRPGMKTLAVSPPVELNLTQAFIDVWTNVLPGKLWIMPLSHWHFELHDGSRDWMPALLVEIGIDPKDLIDRNNAAAIEFTPSEVESARHFITGLLNGLTGSDFLLAPMNWSVLCTLHHHKQLWWIRDKNELSKVVHPSDFSLLPE